jgi:Zn-dependent protease/CBS domain-containing protein
VNGGVPVGRLFGVTVRLSPAWIILAAVVTVLGAEEAMTAAPSLSMAVQWVLGTVVAAGFLVSVVVHEIAHALVARRLGVPVDEVVVGFAGGIGAGVPRAAAPREEIAIAMSGPLVSIAIGAACMPFAAVAGAAGGSMAALATGLLIVGTLNVVLGVLSLVPAVPLDGARVVRALAWGRTGDLHRAGVITARSGRYVGWVTMGVGIAFAAMGQPTEGLLVIAMGWVLVRSSQALDRRLGLQDLLDGATVSEGMEPEGPIVTPNLTLDTFADRYQGEAAVPAVAVVEEGRVVGVIGVRRLQRLRKDRFAMTRAGEVMATPPAAPILAPGDPLWDAAELMDRQGLDGLAVADERGLLGMVTSATIGRAIRRRHEARRSAVNS